MAILEKQVQVTLSGSNIGYYESLGYDIPKWLDTKGCMSVKQGTKISVNVEDLSYGSGVKVTKICDEINCLRNVPNQSYASIINYRNNGDGKDRCFKCGRDKAGRTILDNVKYENSLEYYAIKNNREYLLKEYSLKNEKEPKYINKSTGAMCTWNCLTCKSEYEMGVSHRTNGGNNCPFCRGLRVNNTNCLWTKNPTISSLLLNNKDGYNVTESSAKKLKFKCPNCNYVDSKCISNVVSQGFSCNRCSDGISYPEKFVTCLLNQLKVEYEREKVFSWSNFPQQGQGCVTGRRIYDFFLPDYNCIIETHGEQHYRETFSSFKSIRTKTLEDQIDNDKFKQQLAKDNGIKNYIVIDCYKSEKDYIKESIENSLIAQLFDLNIVNWVECDAWAVKSMVKEVCEYWEKNDVSLNEVAEHFKIKRGTLWRYLSKGAELNWCDYVPIKGGANKKSVVQLTLNGEFIKEWSSARSAAIELEINLTGVTDVIKGRLRTSGGFKWVLKEKYNPTEELKKGRETNNIYGRKKIVQLTLDDRYVETWEGTRDAERHTGVYRNYILKVLKKEREQTGGYKWLYAEEYYKENKQTDNQNESLFVYK
jgi:hypothetical protein